MFAIGHTTKVASTNKGIAKTFNKAINQLFGACLRFPRRRRR